MKYVINENELKIINNLIRSVLLEFKSSESEKFLLQASLIAHDLPRGLRLFLNDYKQHEDLYTHCIISGYEINDSHLGKSPKHWKNKEPHHSTIAEEMYFILCASLIGNPIAWSTQQDSNIVHEIFPIKEHESDQLGFSSKENLEWHTEDAFHPFRGDYIALMCMRNPTLTSTLVASTKDIDLTLDKYKVLFKTIFYIKPDNSHLQFSTKSDETNNLSNAQSNMLKMKTQPTPLAVLYGDPKNPYWRIDPYFMDTPKDPEAKEALYSLTEEINLNLKEVLLSKGEILFVDNYRTVHGRAPFTAKYDGFDRWLKRLNIVNDLRKSRSIRKTCTSRVLY